jgi:hypothetical protein
MHRRTDHTDHDPTLIAGHAAGDLAAAQLMLADRLLASCEDCARLHADLRAIAAATRAMPAWTTAAPRDFRLAPADAQRLRHRGPWLRLLRPFASPTSVTRPLAATLSTLGAAGLAIVLLLPALGGTAAGLGPTFERNGQALDVTASAAPEAPVPGGAAAATFRTGSATGDVKTETPEEDFVAGGAGPEADDNELGPASISSQSLALIGSAGMLLAGLALFGLRMAARRLA